MLPHLHRSRHARTDCVPGGVSRVLAAVLAVAFAVGTAAVAEPSDNPVRSAIAPRFTPRVLDATPAMLQPFRGSGTWVDVYDWSKRYGGAKFGLADVDKVAAAGYQTLYIQTSKAKLPDAVLEPARLKSLIRRAHERGMSVVGWYLPSHDDEWRDYRKTIAMIRLGVDGIGLDLESTVVKDVPKRSEAAVRLMRRVAAKVASTGQPLALASITYTPFTLDSSKRLWPNFPWRELAEYTHVWMPMSYWSQQLRRNNGMDNATTFTNDSITRLRQRLGDDARIHMIGGSGTSKLQVQRMVGAIQAAGSNVIGGSLYDWRTTSSASHPQMRPLRNLRAPAPGAVSDVAASGDTVAFRAPGGNIRLQRVRDDGGWWSQRDILGSATGTPSVAVDYRGNTDRWFVVTQTAAGISWALGTDRSNASRLAAAPRAPAGCTPTASRWSRAGFVVLCRTGAAVTFALYTASAGSWSAWTSVPLPDVASITDLTAAPLGSQVVLAWAGAGGAVSTALWDPALPNSVTVASVVDGAGAPLTTSVALRLNGYIDENSDTAAGLWLMSRAGGSVTATWLTRDSFSAATVVAGATKTDTAQPGPLAEAFVSTTDARLVTRVSGALWLGPLVSREPSPPK